MCVAATSLAEERNEYLLCLWALVDICLKLVWVSVSADCKAEGDFV
jgi:hypothetical protein